MKPGRSLRAAVVVAADVDRAAVAVLAEAAVAAAAAVDLASGANRAGSLLHLMN
jgi:hypothetical protein